MKIKKKNHNEYLIIDDGIWVRNFALPECPAADENYHLFSSEDLTLCLQNETQNYKLRLPQISTESIILSNVIIISDGFEFNSKKSTLTKLPKNVNVIGVNDMLDEWFSTPYLKPISYYVVNNPYVECMRNFPKKSKGFLPPCIASVRTHSPFVKQYAENSTVYFYTPTPNRYYSGLDQGTNYYYIDDYRNPICAAISLSFNFKVQKLLLMCHDNCFTAKRPAAVQVENDLWAYPQQITSNQIIDAHLGWLKKQNVQIRYHSTGLKLKNAEYIALEDIASFFEEI